MHRTTESKTKRHWARNPSLATTTNHVNPISVNPFLNASQFWFGSSTGDLSSAKGSLNSGTTHATVSATSVAYLDPVSLHQVFVEDLLLTEVPTAEVTLLAFPYDKFRSLVVA